MKIPIWFPIIFFVANVAVASANPQTNATKLSETEQWILARVRAGGPADLSEGFPEKEKRKVTVSFLRDLLTGTLPDVKPGRLGVRISGAVIDEAFELSNTEIPYQVGLDHCQFNGSVNFARAHFTHAVLFDDSVFNKDVNFNGARVERTIFFRNTIFKDHAEFTTVQITGQFVADGAQFQSETQSVDFNTIRIGDSAFFTKAVFKGPVEFVLANIGINFEATDATFTYKDKAVDFNSMKVGHIAFFWNVKFEGSASFVLVAIVNNFEVNGATFGNQKQTADFNSMKVGGTAFFNSTAFEGPVNLTNADFARLELSDARWPNVPAEIKMLGMSYKSISAGTDMHESHDTLLRLADRAVYTADVYRNLEEFFLRQGYRADADRAFIASKHRERKQLSWWQPAWLGSMFLNLLVGYGRHPWQAMIPCAFFIALGCVFFSPERMELQKKPDEGDPARVYNRFWYSLGLFLPFVNLHTTELWKPKTTHALLRNYVRVHILLGWILIPIVLAALTGLIK